jgi:CBS domain-containing protein
LFSNPLPEGSAVTTVKTCLDQKPKPTVLVSVGPDDLVVTALQLMRDKHVRAILVLEAERLLGIVTQGDCAIKVLLPGLDAKNVAVKDIMTAEPMTVKLTDPLEACMGLMASRNFRHLPVLDAGRVVGVVSIGDVVKDTIRQMGQQISFLETYIKGHGA